MAPHCWSRTKLVRLPFEDPFGAYQCWAGRLTDLEISLHKPPPGLLTDKDWFTQTEELYFWPKATAANPTNSLLCPVWFLIQYGRQMAPPFDSGWGVNSRPKGHSGKFQSMGKTCTPCCPAGTILPANAAENGLPTVNISSSSLKAISGALPRKGTGSGRSVPSLYR